MNSEVAMTIHIECRCTRNQLLLDKKFHREVAITMKLVCREGSCNDTFVYIEVAMAQCDSGIDGLLHFLKRQIQLPLGYIQQSST